MHTNEDPGKPFKDANGELSGLAVLAGCKARAQKEEISLSPWESIAYWYKEPSNLSSLLKQFTWKEKTPKPNKQREERKKGISVANWQEWLYWVSADEIYPQQRVTRNKRGFMTF